MPPDLLVFILLGVIVLMVGLCLFFLKKQEVVKALYGVAQESQLQLQEKILSLQSALHLMSENYRQESISCSGLQEKVRSLLPLESQLEQLRELYNSLQMHHAKLQAEVVQEKKNMDEKLSLLQAAEARWTELFQSLSLQVLQKNNQSFLTLAQATLEKFQEGAKNDLQYRQQAITEMVKPVKESLDKFDGKILELEKARTGAYESLTQQVRSLMETQYQLKTETTNLVNALKAPSVRGRWGEIQLKRVVEMAGMLDHCDFFEQESVTTETGRLRPDLLVKLPGNKQIVVDAKAPLSAFLEALEIPQEDLKRQKIKDHARLVRQHVTALAKKSYWDQFQPTPEFVILFLPGETYFSAALEHDPSLIEMGVDQGVILATPTTLIALLRAVSYGWRQEALSENAKVMGDLGRELYKRVTDMAEHWSRVGKSLDSAVQAYNRCVGSLEARVLVTARKFKEMEPSLPELLAMTPVEQITRSLQAPDLLCTDGTDVALLAADPANAQEGLL